MVDAGAYHSVLELVVYFILRKVVCSTCTRVWRTHLGSGRSKLAYTVRGLSQSLQQNMFRRRTGVALNSRRWFSHQSGPRKSSYALTRGAAVAASVAAVAGATIAGHQKFMEGPIHNDAPPSSVPETASRNVRPTVPAKVRVGGDDEELQLLVWGSNRFAQHPLLDLRRAHRTRNY